MKNIRRIIITMAVLIIAFSMVMANFSVAYASTIVNAYNLSDNSFSLGSVPSEIELGEEITLPTESGVTYLVKNPSGEEITLSSNAFIPEQTGYYTVNVYKSNGNIIYEGFKILVTGDDAEIYIPYNGADIPTYISTEGTFNIPLATMVVWDEDDNNEIDTEATQEANTDYTISYKVVLPEAISGVTDANNAVTLNAADATEISGTDYLSFPIAGVDLTSATYTVRYIATHKDLSTLVKTKDFTVNVQEEFTDEVKPEFSVSGWLNTAPQNEKITLPKVTPTDNYDTNIKVTISVLDPDGNAVTVFDDEDEQFLVDTEEPVKFDNNKVMSFYPTKAGYYTALYTATDDAGNSASWELKTSVSDTKGPVIELSENTPATWGIILENAEGVFEGESRKLVIEKPYIWDRVSQIYDRDTGELLEDANNEPYDIWDYSSDNTSPIKAYLTIKNSSKKIYDSQNPSAYTDGFVEFTEDNIVVNFDVLDTKTGTFTFTVTARDTNSSGKLLNYSTQSFTVTVIESYTDIYKPTIQLTQVPKYILKDKKFTEPEITLGDKTISGVTTKTVEDITYTFISSEAGVNPVEFDFEDEAYFIPETAGTILISYNASDALGNKAYDTNQTLEIPVYDTEIVTAAPTVAGNWEGNTAATSLFDASDNLRTDIEAGDTININDIVITSTSTEYDFLGYELIVRKDGTITADGEGYVGAGQLIKTKVESYYTVIEDGNDTLTLKNIEFTVPTAGTYSILLRAFNASGASAFSALVFDVNPQDDDVEPFSLAASSSNVAPLSYNETIASEVELGEEIVLPSTNGTYNYDYRIISGTAYQLRGDLFTAKSRDTYAITLAQMTSDKSGIIAASKYTTNTTAVDSTSPVIEVLGDVKPYYNKWTAALQTAKVVELMVADDTLTQAEAEILAKKELYVEIPSASITDNGIIDEILTKVTDANGERVNIETIEGKKYFAPSKDGTYTITYTVSDTDNTQTYSITVQVGDLIKPLFTEEGLNKIAPKASYTKGSKAYFVVVDDIDEEDVSENITDFDDLNITLTVKLGSEEISVSYDDDGDPYYLLEATGDYTVTYKIVDEAGNEYFKEYTVSVTGEGKSVVNYKVLSTVLIITAVILIIGVGVYFFRFRRIKEK